VNVCIPQLRQRGVNVTSALSTLAAATPTSTPAPAVTPLTTPVEYTPLPTSNLTPTPPPAQHNETPFNVWVIIGPVLAVLAAGGLVYYVLRKRK